MAEPLVFQRLNASTTVHEGSLPESPDQVDADFGIRQGRVNQPCKPVAAWPLLVFAWLADEDEQRRCSLGAPRALKVGTAALGGDDVLPPSTQTTSARDGL